MKPIVAFAALFWNLAFAAAPSTDKPEAHRFQAATSYFKWLKTERPELYMHATYRRPERRHVSDRPPLQPQTGTTLKPTPGRPSP